MCPGIPPWEQRLGRLRFYQRDANPLGGNGVRRNPDGRQHNLARECRARVERKPSLHHAEGDRRMGTHATPARHASTCVQAGRDVYRDGWHIGAIEQIDQVAHQTRHLAARARAQEGINREVGLREELRRFIGRAHLRDRHAQIRRDPRLDLRVARKLLSRRSQEDAHARPLAVQVPGDHQTIAPVVALPTEGNDGAPHHIAKRFSGGGDDCQAGVLHQHEGGDPNLLDGTPVDAATLRGVGRIHGFSLPAGPRFQGRQANPL